MQTSLWNGNSPAQAVYQQLQQLIPAEGSVAQPRRNPALERLRRAANCYYDLYNNGLINRAAEFARVFGIRSSLYRRRWGRGHHAELYQLTEQRMLEIIAQAAAEQRITAA